MGELSSDDLEKYDRVTTILDLFSGKYGEQEYLRHCM